jgi:creatinine amidohydrolase/Fe(II)-dependent formamide hydrolase-like protein
MRGQWLADLTWQDAEARRRDGALVVVPVGAAAKAHGPHLPLDTDRTLARALAEGVAHELPVLIAPIIDQGWYPAFTGYPGSQSRVRMDRAVREPAHDAPPTVFRVPVTVRDDPAAGDGHSRTGASGDPTLASAGKGVAILGAMVRDLVDGLRVRHPDAPGVR